MISRVNSFVLQGIDPLACEIEADLSPVGLPKITVVGLPDAAVKESSERVRTAMLNSGYRFPQTRMTINLAPADVKKEGPVYDLPMAIAIMRADGTIAPADPGSVRRPDPQHYFIAGELALDGRIRPVNGAISLAMLAKDAGAKGIIIPEVNAPEAAVVDGIDVLGVRELAHVVGFFNGERTITPHPAIDAETLIERAEPEIDFADVRGQEAAKRAITIAAAGGHNLLMLGPAGTGKTMMAKAFPGILPCLTREEALEVTRIYSSIGAVPRDQPIILTRPVRTPHHTASAPAVIGGGTIPRPGDVSLAHRGILFLDEMPEFSRAVLETLRQPLEDGCVTVARAHGSVRFPARFMLLGALNPTPKGHAANDETSQRAMDRYLSRISGPLIDRVDLHVEVPAVPFRSLTGAPRGTSTDEMRRRVCRAREVQQARQGRTINSELSGRDLDRLAPLDEDGTAMLAQAMREMNLSARAYDKIRRTARTIADLEGESDITAAHITEAVQYRLLDRLTNAA